MNPDLLNVPDACRAALAALEQDPLDLAPEVAAHLKACPACAEARVLWLAQEDASPALAPAGYFSHLPDRVMAKLPPKAPAKRAHPFLWAAAATLLGAAALGGFMAGRANRTPVVEASLPHAPAEVHEANQPEAPFQEKEEVLTEIEALSPEQIQALAAKLKATKSRTETP